MEKAVVNRFHYCANIHKFLIFAMLWASEVEKVKQDL